MTRAKAYLFGGVEIRWHCDPALDRQRRRRAGGSDLPFRERPRGLSQGDDQRRDAGASRHLRRQVGEAGRPRRGRMGGRLRRRRRPFLSSYCNTIPTPDGGTHESGLRSALAKGIKDHAERTNQGKRAAAVTSDDVMAGAACMLSVFIREPEFQGQTKDRLATNEATRIVENAIKDPFDHWLAANPGAGQQAPRFRDRARRRAPPPQAGEGNLPQDARRASSASPASSPTAPRPPPTAPSCSSSKATPPAAPPSRRATAPPRRCCRCAARSSTSPPPAATSSRRTSSSPT